MLRLFRTAAVLSQEVNESKFVPTVPSEQEDEFTSEYQTLAARLGIEVQPYHTPLRKWLAEEGIPCYDEQRVGAYLDKMFGANDPRYNTQDQHWIWRHVREAVTYSSLSRVAGANVGYSPLVVRSYAKPIPYPVLITMDRVRTQFHGAQFFISDALTEEEKTRMRDPFLLVVLDEERYIIERWDEPKFRP